MDHLERGEDGLQSRGVEQGVHGEGDVSRVAAVVVWHLGEIHFCISVFLYFSSHGISPQSGSALLG